MRPETPASVASPDVLQATQGIKLFLLDSKGVFKSTCRSKAHTGNSKDPGTFSNPVLNQIYKKDRYLRCFQGHTGILPFRTCWFQTYLAYGFV